MKKMIPVLVALVLIAVVVVVAFGGKISDKYSYGTEVADLDAYFGGGLAEGGADGELAIVLQDEVLEDRAVVFENHIYFELETVKEYLNDRFFLSEEEQLMLYTRAEDTLEVKFGERSFSDGDGVHETGYVICRQQGEKIYFAEEFLHDFADFSCERFEKHVQLYTEWGVRQTYEVSRDTQVRVKGGIKSPILKELAKGEKVEFLEEMETWSRVKTSDSLIGYVENKYLTNLSSELETPVTTRQPEEIPSLQMEGKVCLGWHSIGGVGGNDTLDAMLEEGLGLNVIAPTWFSLTDNEGNFRSFASEQYVKRAHDKGLKVWGVWDNFNYRNETGSEVSTYQVLSSTEKRKALETAIINTSLELGLDGVNLDFEELTADAGKYYVQFIRELSVLTRANNLILSVDNYMPNSGNTFYRLDVQGEFADYVILMGYDEHWHGCKDPGSVASIGFVTDGIEKALEKVPAQKLVNALPFYTILWKTEGTEVTDSYITLNNMDDFLARMGKEPAWDEETCQYYAEWESGDALYQIWIEDEASLKTKLNVMGAHKLGGVAVWRLGYGTKGAWNLVKMFGDL